MAGLERYSNRFKQTYKMGKNGKRYLRRAQTNYLHFHTFNIESTPPTVIQNAKQQILQDFAFGFKQNTKKLTVAPFNTMSFEEMRMWLKDWTSGYQGGIIGQEMADTIAEKLQSDPYTGAGIVKGFNETFSKGGRVSLAGKNVAEQCDYVMDLIWNYLSRYCQVFDENGEDALLLKCLELAQIGANGGSKSAADILAKYNNKKIPVAAQNSLSAKVQSNFATLSKILEQAQQAAAMGRGGAGITTMRNTFGDKKWTPKKMAKQLGSIFNALGGEQVGEIVGSAAAVEVLQKGDKEVIRRLEQMFAASGGKIVVGVAKTGEDTIQIGDGLPIQQKGDWSIVIQKGRVVVRIPVSSKLYQGGSNGKKYTPIGEPFNGIIAAQTIGLDQLLAITLNGSVDWLEQHMAALSRVPQGRWADLGNQGDPAAYALWKEFKEAAKYTGLFRALVGTGAKTKSGIDFAALLIVNNQIYSMADILKAFVIKPELFMAGKGNGPDNIPNWTEVRQAIAGPFYGQHMGEIDINQRLSTQYSAIRTLYGKKYNFEINIGMIKGVIANLT